MLLNWVVSDFSRPDPDGKIDSDRGRKKIILRGTQINAERA